MLFYCRVLSICKNPTADYAQPESRRKQRASRLASIPIFFHARWMYVTFGTRTPGGFPRAHARTDANAASPIFRNRKLACKKNSTEWQGRITAFFFFFFFFPRNTKHMVGKYCTYRHLQHRIDYHRRFPTSKGRITVEEGRDRYINKKKKKNPKVPLKQKTHS